MSTCQVYAVVEELFYTKIGQVSISTEAIFFNLEDANFFAMERASKVYNDKFSDFQWSNWRYIKGYEGLDYACGQIQFKDTSYKCFVKKDGVKIVVKDIIKYSIYVQRTFLN